MISRPTSAIDRAKRKSEITQSLLRDAKASGALSASLNTAKVTSRPVSAALHREIAALTNQVTLIETSRMSQSSVDDANAIARMDIQLLEEEVAMTQGAIEYLRQTAEYVKRKPVDHRRAVLCATTEVKVAQ